MEASSSEHSGRKQPGLSELSGRELDVTALLAAGKTNRQIARLLAITEGTVKTHVSNILRKLNAANRAQAVSFWLSS